MRADADGGALAVTAKDGAPARKPEQAPLWRRALNLAQGEPNVADVPGFYGAIMLRLSASQALPSDALARLGADRSNAIAAALVAAGVDAGRVAQGAPEKTEAKAGVVPLKLGLSAR